MKRENDIWWIVGLILTGWIFWTLLTAGACILFGGGMPGLTGVFAFIASAITAGFLSGRHLHRWRTLVSAALIAGGFGILCAYLSALIYDTSFDSMGYHFDIILGLERGWNPVYGTGGSGETGGYGGLWGQHYAKGLEICGAAAATLTGRLESAKGANFILYAGACLVTAGALRRGFPTLRRKARYGVTVLAAANPVVLNQLLSVYNDFTLWLETLLILSSFVILWREPRNRAAFSLLLMAMTIAVNTKFTHFFYAGMESLFFLGWCIYFKRRDIIPRGVGAVAAGVILGVCVVGWNPYITNTVGYGSPVYPLGTDEVDIMTGNTPDIFADGNRVENLFKSLLSVKDAGWGLVNGTATLGGIMNSYTTAANVNGFGVLMWLLLAGGFILMLLPGGRDASGPLDGSADSPHSTPQIRETSNGCWWSVYIFTFLLGLCFEQSWWARYIPFLWLMILLPVLRAFLYGGCRMRGLAWGFCILAWINGAAAFGGSLAPRLGYTRYLNYIFRTAGATGRPITVTELWGPMRERFREEGVTINEVPPGEPLPSEELFYFFGDGEFESAMLLPAQDYPELYSDGGGILWQLTGRNNRKVHPLE